MNIVCLRNFNFNSVNFILIILNSSQHVLTHSHNETDELREYISNYMVQLLE